MATYKGIGYDTTAAKVRTGTASDDISFDSLITATDGVTVSAVGLTVAAGGAAITGGTTSDTLTVTGDASVGGDLTVTGDIVSRGAIDVLVRDNFLDLNAGNTSATALSGGFTFTLNRNSGFTASTVTTFVAGSAGVSNPTFTNTDATGSTALAALDVVFITGAGQAGNDGLYVVSAVNQATFPQTVTIKGIGTTATSGSTPFAQTQFEAEAGATATAYKVDLKVLAVADGTVNFKDSGGSAYAIGTLIETYAATGTGAVEGDFTGNADYSEVGGGAVSLQNAYDTGNSITTDASGAIAFTFDTNARGFAMDGDAAGVGDVTMGATNTINTLTVDSGGVISLDSVGASNFTTTGGALTLSGAGLNLAGGAAEIDVTTTGALDMNCAAATLDASAGLVAALSGAASTITSTAQDLTIGTATSGTLKLDAAALLNIDAAANLDVDVTGTVDILASSTFSIDGTGASNITATSGTLTLSSATSGDVVVSSAAAASLSAASGSAVQVSDGVLTLSATSGALSESGLTNCDLSGSGTMNITGGGVSTFGDDTAVWSFDGVGNLSETGMVSAAITPSAAITLTGGAASSFTTSAGALTLTSAAAATWSTGAGALELGGAAGVTVTSTGGTLTLNGTGQTVDLNSNALDIDAAGAVTIDTTANNGFSVTCGTSESTTSTAIVTAGFPSLAKKVRTISGLTQGDVAYFGWDGVGSRLVAEKADSDAIGTARFGGIAVATAAGGADAQLIVAGIASNVTSDTSLTAASHVGKPVYISGTAGKISPTPPSGTADVVFQVGICLGGSGTAWRVLVQPQFIMEIG